MNPKKLLLFLPAILVFLLASCGQPALNPPSALVISQQNTATSASATQARQYTIALVMKTLTNPFFVAMEKGARRAEKEFGIKLLVKTGAQETSVEQQITIIEGLIQDKVDAIVIAPADSTELIPVLKKAQDAGIVIVNIDNQLDPQASEKIGLKNVPLISVNNEQGAYLSARFIGDRATQPTQAIILEGIRTAKNADDRKKGAVRAFSENKNITVVAQETANWKIDEAHKVIGSLFEQYPNVKIIFCANDMMAFGVIQYLEESKRSDVMVASYDALDEAKKFIQEGKLQATIDQQAAVQGYDGIQFAVRALKGEKLPAVLLVDVMLVTKDNIK